MAVGKGSLNRVVAKTKKSEIVTLLPNNVVDVEISAIKFSEVKDNALMEESVKMKENGDVVHKNVTSLSEASDEILKNTHTMIFHLNEIKESAEGASESATINLGLAENLNSLVLGYKTE